ncbi:hypothetical protein SteCoe_38142 [Stentor coeruleus]|uniref:Uncharacterized protein n=1 Tax=Stentor coeruleus TaxID=5963 RepID=A0A1R2ALS9_9CILI|nr:hypothetical protein SteCoe_38142 [Stentor coeruleus]
MKKKVKEILEKYLNTKEEVNLEQVADKMYQEENKVDKLEETEYEENKEENKVDKLEETEYEENKLKQDLNEKNKYIKDFEAFIEDALSRTYILQMQPSLYGLTTFNKKIFINPFDISLKPSAIEKEAAILLTIFHELAHYFRRINCLTYADVRAIYTPKNENIKRDDVSSMSEYEFMNKKGEADAELQLLGRRIITINKSASKFLFEGDLNDLEYFRDQLFKENEKVEEQRIYVGKSNFQVIELFKLKCGVSHS